MIIKLSRVLIIPLVICFLIGILGIAIFSRSAKIHQTENHHLESSSWDISVDFLIPMAKQNISPKIKVIPDSPLTQITYKVSWINSTTIRIVLSQSGGHQGQLVKLEIDGAPTVIPLIKKHITAELRQNVPLKLISKYHLDNIPSQGPVNIIFNSPVTQEAMNSSVILPTKGQLLPYKYFTKDQHYYDYSRWLYVPENSFKHSGKYRIVIKPDIRNKSGNPLGVRKEIVFTVKSAPGVIASKPTKNAHNVNLYIPIVITADQTLATATVQVFDASSKDTVPGRTLINGHKITFKPLKCFVPGTTYQVTVQGESLDNEPLAENTFNFTTVDMGNKTWVEVSLSQKHNMTVYKGENIIRVMPVSGGKKTSPTPLGNFYTQDRGASFWSPRFGEGATYWVRLVGQILVHSVPRDNQWRIKEDEHEKLGLPASHGCVRLSEENAKWFYENIPRGTLVIIHS